MAEYTERTILTPHILIVAGENDLHNQLGQVFKHRDMSYESVSSVEAAQDRLNDGEPPVTGVLTGGLKGEYPLVIEAARQIGASAVLLTRSTLILREAQEAEIPAYLQNRIIGPMKDIRVVNTMLLDLAPRRVLPRQA